MSDIWGLTFSIPAEGCLATIKTVKTIKAIKTVQSNVPGVSDGLSKIQPATIFLHVGFLPMAPLLLAQGVGALGVGNVAKSFAESTLTL